MAKRRRIIELSALIVVGEGLHDKAFLNHMKTLYDGRSTGQTVKIDSADGGSPKSIIKTTIRKYRHVAYDKKYVLMDSDVVITAQDFGMAKKAKIELVLSTPVCLEGMLLEVLGQVAPVNNDACNAALHPQLAGPPTDKRSYVNIFPAAVLDATRKDQIVVLRDVIANQ